MKQPSFEKSQHTAELIFAYEAMSHEKAGSFFEEAAFLTIADWYSENGSPEKALLALENALHHHCLSVDLHLLRSQLLLQQGAGAAALDTIARLPEIVPEEQLPIAFRAEAYCRRGDFEKAINTLEMLKTPMTLEKATAFGLWQAQIFQQAEEYGKMFDTLAEMAIRQPDNEEVLEEIWMCVEINENYKDSLALHETVLDRHPYSHYAWHNLGFAQKHLGQMEEALESFEYAFIANPTFVAGYREFGALAFEQGFYKRALQCYREMAENLGEDADIFVLIGQCYHRLGDHKIARIMYEKALKIDPDHAEAFFQIGQCCAGQKEYLAALKWLREAVRTEGRREEFHAALAEVLYTLNKPEEALEHYWKAVEIAPDEQRHWAALSKFLMVTGQSEEALEVLDSALENVVERNEIFYCRSACLFLLGERRKAIRQLRQALSMDFGSHPSLFCLAPALADDLDVRRLIERFQ